METNTTGVNLDSVTIQETGKNVVYHVALKKTPKNIYLYCAKISI